MSDNDPGPLPSLTDATFHSVEEVNELAHLMGREGEYRQLSKGPVTSRWRWLDLGQFSLTSHRLDKRIHARLTPPKGCVTLAIMPPPFFMLVDGAELGNDQVLVMDAASEADFVTVDEAECATLTLPKSIFEASARALFPWMRTDGEPIRILSGPSSRWSTLHHEMMGLLRDGRMSPEEVSHLLSQFLHWMAGEQEKRLVEGSLGNGSTRRVVRRAQEYIEEHYPRTIRMEDICGYTGVSARTLQRFFSGYFQVSPLEYIKVRRLNAARQALVAATSSHHSVTQIAIESGFTHLGRFSIDYRQHFAELPRETLAKPLTSGMVRQYLSDR